MPRHRAELPQLTGRPFVTDGGLETTLLFKYGIDLPGFAAFPLLDTEAGLAALRRYFATYVDLAHRLGLGLVLEAPTWRASSDWAVALGYPLDRLPDVQRRAVALLLEFRHLLDQVSIASVLSGNLGPRGDGYVPSARMTADEASAYHAPQIEAFAASDADMVSAFTLNYVDEAVGIAAAARSRGMPVVLSFTVETDGRLPTGESLEQAIETTDDATDGYPAYYMINCAHPTHVLASLMPSGSWRQRIRGVRANASAKSHAELNDSTTLDEGDPEAFGALHHELRQAFPRLCVIGGCCGTDHRHVERAGMTLRSASPPPN